MSKKLIPPYVAENYIYQETYITGATKEIPLTYEINIFKHKTEEGSYCATEIKTHLVEYAGQFHIIFTHSPLEVERRMNKQGLSLTGVRLKRTLRIVRIKRIIKTICLTLKLSPCIWFI
ncbi:hypothetical protein PP175_27910 (plasmid) [Aneurinibacillus sp. Ricciae_BoGa-3]|uniref:hypothetical protein n=1 Tax=Aneurinibacillus sp. Ricciae_BoGa-3 TaxID=3022697 RepID=UPI002341C434|nr:hypothetical protein [Aneurinibacillus sp. Ricciae_BoGa-3]WCK57018.1 hypothetical protein PP175_27910 [Aneurinibacillus sp. Ricciae_BoGa-3]